MKRQPGIDALRGLMLVLMTSTHLPTQLAEPLGQPLGFVSTAEGFVLLSAFMAGLVYGRMGRHSGVAAMQRAVLRRAWKVYACQIGVLMFLFTVIAVWGSRAQQPAVTDLLSFYFEHPLTATAMGLALVYQPPLLDILTMYVLFMLASPWVLAHGMRHGWGGLMAVSVGLWLLSQFGLSEWLYGALVALTGLGVPYSETGAFATFSWQFLWMLGLWMGESRSTAGAQPFAFGRGAVALAALIALACLVWRHAVGQAPFGGDEDLNLLFDKWQIGPLRLINLFALMVLVIRFGPWLEQRLPRLRWLEALGKASLPVFCAHLVVVLVVLSAFGGMYPPRPWWLDGLLLAGCYAVLTAVAWFANALPRPAAGVSGRRTAPLPAPRQARGSR